MTTRDPNGKGATYATSSPKNPSVLFCLGVLTFLLSALPTPSFAADTTPLTLYQLGQTLTYSRDEIVAIRHKRDARSDAIDLEFTITKAAAARQEAFTGALVGGTIGIVLDGWIGSDDTTVRDALGLTRFHTFMPDTPAFADRARRIEARLEGHAPDTLPPVFFAFERKAKVTLEPHAIADCRVGNGAIELRLAPEFWRATAATPDFAAGADKTRWLVAIGDEVLVDWRTASLSADGIVTGALIKPATPCPPGVGQSTP